MLMRSQRATSTRISRNNVLSIGAGDCKIAHYKPRGKKDFIDDCEFSVPVIAQRVRVGDEY